MLNGIDAVSLVGPGAKLGRRGGKVKQVRRQEETEDLAALIVWADQTVIDGIKLRDYLNPIPNQGKRGSWTFRDLNKSYKIAVPNIFPNLKVNKK